MNPIELTFCSATRSKNNPEQCKNKRKEDSIFCGVHANCGQDRIYVKESLPSTLPPLLPEEKVEEKMYEKVDALSMDIKSSFEKFMVPEDAEQEIVIQNDAHLRDLIMNHRGSALNVTILRNYIKNHPILKSHIHAKGSKNSMIQELILYYQREEYYSKNVDKIVCVQSIVRRWSVIRRNRCTNKTDILTMDLIYDIPSTYFYIFHDAKSHNLYGYDIRTFTHILYNKNLSANFVAKCPYTLRPYEAEEIIRIEWYIEKLKKSGVSLEIEKPKLSKEKEIELKCVDIFLRMDMLDNYTQSKWFMDLDVRGLLAFYDAARDIWNYRIGMPMQNKLRILSNGYAFEMPRAFLAKLPSKLALQNFILNEMNRFITEGVNREEKKLGAMLMLTALVEVSPAAASALPHLVQ